MQSLGPGQQHRTPHTHRSLQQHQMSTSIPATRPLQPHVPPCAASTSTPAPRPFSRHSVRSQSPHSCSSNALAALDALSMQQAFSTWHQGFSTLPASRRRVAAAASTSTPAAPAERTTAANWSERLTMVGRRPAQEGDLLRIAPPKQRNTFGGSDGRADGYVEGDEDDRLGGVKDKKLPAEIRCFDTASILVRSGDGGNGCVAFRREKCVEFGGPAGGNGGRGGHVWAVVDPELNSLTSFRQRVHWRADTGVPGQGSQLDGAAAPDLLVPVPPGTIIRRKGATPSEPPLAELLQPGQKALLVSGGRGGRGNYSFKTSTNKAPTLAEKGETGSESWVEMELKLVADVGIIGVPNAGKSTLLSVLTAARPKIAAYPFTTLVPNLGVCEMDYTTTVFADVPGLLEGAHEGLGLGHEFLRHVQRCRALVHVVDGSSPDPLGDLRAINLELELFNPALKDKPQIIAYNKVDLPDSGGYWEDVKESLVNDFGIAEDRMFAVSAATGQGVTQLVRAVRKLLTSMGPAKLEQETNAINAERIPRKGFGNSTLIGLTSSAGASLDNFTITVDRGGSTNVYFVQGMGIEKFAQMTNWDYYEAVKRFQRVLEVSGINAALKARGVVEGDTVVISDSAFTWSDDRRESRLYRMWTDDMKGRGVNRQGTASWPHVQIARSEPADLKKTKPIEVRRALGSGSSSGKNSKAAAAERW